MVDKKQLQIAVGKRIIELRKIKKISQQDLAGACNIEKSNFSRIEAGNTNPTIYTLKKIAVALNVSLSDLLKIEISQQTRNSY